jgi:hypothetical protein
VYGNGVTDASLGGLAEIQEEISPHTVISVLKLTPEFP